MGALLEVGEGKMLVLRDDWTDGLADNASGWQTSRYLLSNHVYGESSLAAMDDGIVSLPAPCQ